MRSQAHARARTISRNEWSICGPGTRLASAPPDAGPVVAAVPAAKDPPWLGDVDGAAPAMFRMMVNRTITVDAGMRGAPTAAANPDDAILERARVAAGGCFASLSPTTLEGEGPAERSAHMVFTVIPTGTVSSANVSSGDTPDDGVLAYLRQQALQTVFSDNGGGPLRTYAIDVRVIAKRNNGGR